MTRLKPPTLGKDTLVTISLGVVAACLVAVAGGAWTLSREISDWESRLNEGYTIREAEAAWREAEKLNASLNAPDVLAIRKRYADSEPHKPVKPLADVKAN